MNIVIIGGSASGMSVAFKAKRENPEANIVVLEKENYISFGACGIPYYIGDVFNDIDKILFVRTLDDARANNIDLFQNHQVTFVDFHKKRVTARDLNTEEEKSFAYDKLMIATGAKPFLPDIEGINPQLSAGQADNVYTLTKPYTAKKLKENLKNYKNIAIVGGGFIGVEVAEQLSKYKNLNISLYHSRDQLLNGVYDRDAGEVIKKEIERLGVNIYFQERLQDVKLDNGRVSEIITTNRKDKVDALIIATGFRPNTEIFDHENLAKLKNGALIVDKYGRTSIDDVWSIGDCASVPHKFLGNTYIPLATSANKIGREIGINLVGTEENLFSSYESLGSNSIKVGEWEFGTTGLTEDQAKDLAYDYGVAKSEVFNRPPYMTDATKVYFKIIYENKSYKILGARVYGKKDAVLRLLPFTTAIHAGLTTKDLAYYDYAYSPPFSLVWEAVNIAASVAK